jgi:hypothetical protein
MKMMMAKVTPTPVPPNNNPITVKIKMIEKMAQAIVLQVPIQLDI